ncbi:MAG: type I secretion system permease/ATPase [Pseudomonadota bacterium]
MAASLPSDGRKELSSAKDALKPLMWRAGTFSFFVNLLMLTGPIYMLQIYDRVLSSRSVETLVVITILTFGLFAAMALLDFARGALLARAGGRFEDSLKTATFNLSADAARRGASGADQPIKDLRQIRQFVSSPALTAVFDAPWTPVFLLVVFLMHWLLGLVAVAGLLILLSLAIINERASRSATAEAHAATVEADRLALSAFRNAAAADAMGMRRPLRERWLKKGGAASSQNVLATDTIGGLTAASKATRLFLQSAILGVGALLAIGGQVTPGVMIAASIITGRALAPVEIVTSQWRNFALTRLSYKRLAKFLASAPAEAEKTALPAPRGAIKVERLYCQPGTAKRPVLKNISFEVEAGEAIGVVGPSAAGKSTLARALVGVEAPRAGEIRLDGALLTQWERDALGAHIGFLPQDIELFAGTAAENISRFASDPAADQIIAAAKAAGAHDMILSFTDGYDTEIGERGAHISAGQRQRLGLARALYGDPAIVVLDEPNANLDGEGDAALAQAVKGLKARGATTIVVAHRPSAIAFVDKLLLLIDGEVRAFGPRDEILKQIAPSQVASFRKPEPRKEDASGAA